MTSNDLESDELPETPEYHKPPLPTEPPIAGVLDGLPLANHVLLSDRIIIDDPDDWAQNYQASHRRHGTAMTSLIIHGDLSNNDSK